MPVEKPVENLYNGGSYSTVIIVNRGSYSHVSPQCTDLSSTRIKSSQFPQKFSTALWKKS
jgi:hypothetical protein